MINKDTDKVPKKIHVQTAGYKTKLPSGQEKRFARRIWDFVVLQNLPAILQCPKQKGRTEQKRPTLVYFAESPVLRSPKGRFP